MLCYAILCYVIAMLCYVMLCYAMLCYVMLCYVMLCYVMLCYVMLCYVMLFHDMLCYAMLYYIMLFCDKLCYAILYLVILCFMLHYNSYFTIKITLYLFIFDERYMDGAYKIDRITLLIRGNDHNMRYLNVKFAENTSNREMYQHNRPL